MNDSTAYDHIRRTAGAYKRGGGIIELSGPGRQSVLSRVVARPTEYAQAGEAVESLVLDEQGAPIDQVLVIVDERESLVLGEHPDLMIAALRRAARELGVDDVTIDVRADWNAVAIEGPKSWTAVAAVPEEEIAGVLLNEWRSVRIAQSDEPAVFVRTGTTAEYGYVVFARSGSQELLQWMTEQAASVGGGAVDHDAIVRARVEVNHPIVGGQFRGLTVRQAGAGWMAGADRQDDFLGKPHPEKLERRLVAATSAADLAVGVDVRAGDTVVGAVHYVAPRAGRDFELALVLLDRPFDVPGLTLMSEAGELTTVSRPTINPLSWAETIE